MTFRWAVPPGRLRINPVQEDLCWLDCDLEAVQVICGHHEIFLCKDHRADLSNGEPPRWSEAGEWPWRRCEVVLVDPLMEAV